MYLSKFDGSGFPAIGSLFFVNLEGGGAQDAWDQRASIGFDFLVPAGGIEVYGEAGINDYGPSTLGYIRYPFHSMVYAAGISKGFMLPLGIPSEVFFECSNLELSQDFQFQWPTTFYAHHQMKTGYTNQGQWLGAGNGTGGNSQYLGIRGWHTRGTFTVYVLRTNIDNDYIYAKSINTLNPANDLDSAITDFRATITPGAVTTWYIYSNIQITIEFALVFEHNPTYEGLSWRKTEIRSNPRCALALKWEQ